MEHRSPERLLVLIPAYNEEGAIWQVVKSVHRTVPHADVLVVDDGSIDNTAHVAKMAGAIVVQHPFNLCIGGAVQTGLKFAQQEGYHTVIRLDGDGQHDPSDIPLLYAVLEKGDADVVVGSRFLGTDLEMRIPFLRRLGIYTFALAVSLLTGSRATDTTSGFLGLNRRAIETLVTYMPQDYPEVESRIILHKAGLKTVELPAHMQARVSGVSSINSWCSIYYAMKVLVSILVATVKDIAVLPREMPNADSY